MPELVRCSGCGAFMETDTHSGAQADAAWNRRAEPDYRALLGKYMRAVGAWTGWGFEELDRTSVFENYHNFTPAEWATLKEIAEEPGG